MMFVNKCWIFGIFFQVAGIFLVNRIFNDIFNIVPVIYVLASIIIYFLIVGLVFHIRKQGKQTLLLMTYLLSPLALAFFSVFLIRNGFNGLPSLDIPRNIYFSAASIIGTLAFSSLIIWYQKSHKFNSSNI